jgi:hypothetical protein
MGDFQQLIRFEVANSAVAFRDRSYDRDSRQELLRDLLGLANAAIEGPRYVFLGVRDTVGGAREVVGTPETAASEVRKLCRALAADFIDPPLAIRVDETLVDGARIVVLILPECDDQPYLLKKTASSSMRIGSGWIRQGTQYKRITRPDLQRIFEHKLLSHSAAAEVRVGFAGKILETQLQLPVLRVDQLPSEAASLKLRKMLQARQVAKEVCAQDGTRIQRLVHAQVFGANELYTPHGEHTLLQRLNRTGQDYEAADRHYEFELCAHKVNFGLENVGGVAFERGTLVLDFARMDGFDIADRIWPSPDGCGAVSEGYPTVDVGPRTIRVQTSLGPIAPGTTAMAFRQPLRLCLREPSIGKTIPVSYSVHGSSLRSAISGTLRIAVVDDQTRSRPPSTCMTTSGRVAGRYRRANGGDSTH